LGRLVPEALRWRPATIVGLLDETPRVRTLSLDVPGWPGHRAGQHVDVRLTAEDGYQAARSYSIASAPHDGRLELTIERLEDGEVSSYLVGDAQEGDQFEVRGPIGGYFVWEPTHGGPLLLVGGGSGIVPLMSMIRLREHANGVVPTRLLYSSRSLDDVIYREELERLGENGLDVVHTLTREQPTGWDGYARRVDREMLEEVGWEPGRMPLAYVCGPTPFVEAVASVLDELGYDRDRIRTERFGPTGG
jgi:ferredoxin-NADP reductase